MQLEWMGEYRDMVEKLIKYCNVYASVYNREMYHGAQIDFSYSQIQVVEYLLENEDLHQNMSEVSSRLGISPSAFSKLINRLSQKGLLEKFHTDKNRKNVIIRVTDLGRQVYQQYSDFIFKEHFSKMFSVADEIPSEFIPKIAQMFDAAICCHKSPKTEELPVLIPIKPSANPQLKNRE